MSFENKLISILKNNQNKKHILLIDGLDSRSIEAAKKHQEQGLVNVSILVRSKEDIKEPSLRYIIIDDYLSKKEELIELYLKVRKGKETREQAENNIFEPPYFAMLLLKSNEVDGVVGGLSYPTSGILRPAFKVIGPKAGVKTISSSMVMSKEDETYLFTDISVIPEPNKEQLVDIANNSSSFAKQLNMEPKIAFLSFSTLGSAKHPRASMVQEATILFNEKTGDKNKAIGEIQFDAALDIDIRKMKYKKESFEGSANVFVFPSLEAGNIGYKIAQRLGNFLAIGPIITGLDKPVNDLSRGSTINDVYNTILVTALQS
ncbi:phosphate acetyltransferase [Mycoplasma marinum]|uniref:Phosphate acetyltransferase n=1 Tax=Mycoplasma marinum TaxID=1937190 RepID=A0A4R0XY89_9MOLU|nr:phosphate acetyltransferase [Mycoplasma marinum]TCG12029.1 phosphate acetyltransferase [Mycoplasma marinum]